MKKTIATILVSLLIILPMCSVAEASSTADIATEYQSLLIGSWELAEGFHFANEAFDKSLDSKFTISEADFSNGTCMIFTSGNGDTYYRWAIDKGYMESVAIITFSADHNFMMLYKPSSAISIVYKRQ